MKTWTNKVQPFLGRKIFGGKFLTHTLHLNILPSLSLSLRLGTGRLGKTREVKEGKGREGAFLSMRIGRSCFSRGKQLIRSFRRRHSFDPSLLLLSSLLWPPASWILHTSGKKGDGTRGGGMAVIRCTETKRGEEAEFRGVDALKGKR